MVADGLPMKEATWCHRLLVGELGARIRLDAVVT
jgi:hypothetical protein